LGKNEFRQVCANHFEHPNMPGNAISIMIDEAVIEKGESIYRHQAEAKKEEEP
jgi:hypothetical protein